MMSGTSNKRPAAAVVAVGEPTFVDLYRPRKRQQPRKRAAQKPDLDRHDELISDSSDDNHTSATVTKPKTIKSRNSSSSSSSHPRVPAGQKYPAAKPKTERIDSTDSSYDPFASFFDLGTGGTLATIRAKLAVGRAAGCTKNAALCRQSPSSPSKVTNAAADTTRTREQGDSSTSEYTKTTTLSNGLDSVLSGELPSDPDTSDDESTPRPLQRKRKPSPPSVPKIERDVSLTPPPQVPAKHMAVLSSISEMLQKMGDNYKSDLSDALSSPSSNSTSLDPALQRVSKRRPINTLAMNSSSTVDIIVNYQRYPSNLAATQSLRIRVRMDDPFEQLMHACCIRWGVERENVIFVYNDTPLFSRGTPSAVRMGDAPVVQVYLRTEYATYQATTLPSSPPKRSLSDSSSQPKQSSSADTVPRVLVKIAHHEYPQLKLSVRATHTMDDLVAMYVKERHPPPSGKSYRIVFEGDTVSPTDTVTEAGLEDGDVVEIHAR